MADVFLSYARTERAKAEPVKRLLEAAGLSVFFDVDGLDGGDVFPDVLDREVKNARVVISLWSPWSLSRPWVRTECRIGRARGVLIPVLIERVDAMQHVPADLFELQAVDLVGFDGSAASPQWAPLMRAVGNALQREDLLPKGATLEPRPAKRGGRLVVIGGIAAALAVAAASLALWRPWEMRGADAVVTPPEITSVPSPAPSAVASKPNADVVPTPSTAAPEPTRAAAIAALQADLARVDFMSKNANARQIIETLLQTHAIATLDAAAAGGSREAQLVMGTAANFGYFTPVDLAKAASLYLKSCDADMAPACSGAANLYGAGQGVAKDEARARVLFGKACDMNFAAACSNLGMMHGMALGGPLNLAASRSFQKKACDDDYLPGCTQLGLLHLNAAATNPSEIDAARTLFEKACEGNEPMGCGNLGFLYANGASVTADLPKAVSLYEKSCTAGFYQGCAYLGFHLAQGLGVTKDYQRGRGLLDQVCTNFRDPFACQSLQQLAPG